MPNLSDPSLSSLEFCVGLPFLPSLELNILFSLLLLLILGLSLFLLKSVALEVLGDPLSFDDLEPFPVMVLAVPDGLLLELDKDEDDLKEENPRVGEAELGIDVLGDELGFWLSWAGFLEAGPLLTPGLSPVWVFGELEPEELDDTLA